MFPNFLFRFPVHQVSFLDWPSEYDFAKVFTILKGRANIDFLVAIASQTVGYYAGCRGGGWGREAGFDRIGTVVDD